MNTHETNHLSLFLSHGAHVFPRRHHHFRYFHPHHGNSIFNNTVRNNGNNGIALYSSAVGPVTGNIIAANTLEGNANFGLNSGGAGGSDPTLHSGNNIFVANVASDSGGVGNDGATNVDFNILHGTVEGDFWTGNKGTYVHSNDPHSAANVSVLDP